MFDSFGGDRRQKTQLLENQHTPESLPSNQPTLSSLTQELIQSYQNRDFKRFQVLIPQILERLEAVKTVYNSHLSKKRRVQPKSITIFEHTPQVLLYSDIPSLASQIDQVNQLESDKNVVRNPRFYQVALNTVCRLEVMIKRFNNHLQKQIT